MKRAGHPDLRAELIYYLRGLAEPADLDRPWDYEAFLRAAEHFLQDEWELATNPRMPVGLLLFPGEVEAVHRVAEAVVEMMRCVPIGFQEMYLGRVGLAEVAAAAAVAVRELQRGEPTGRSNK